MNKPKVYFVNGVAVAMVGEHLFKNVICGVGSCINAWKDIANVVELLPGEEGVYYLQNEGSGSDYGDGYLVASEGVVAKGLNGQDGSIGATLSPIRSYSEYKAGIQAIKDLLELRLDDSLYQNLLRFLYIGVCGEMEGYLSSTIIALIQGVRKVYLLLRNFDGFPPFVKKEDENKWRDALVYYLNDHFQFQHIRNRSSKERRIYELLLGHKIKIEQDLITAVEWRNKLAHKTPFYSQDIYPTKKSILLFIEQANDLVNYIDQHIIEYKGRWLEAV